MLGLEVSVLVQKHIFIAVYVENLLIDGLLIIKLCILKLHLEKQFDIINLKTCHCYFGILIYRIKILYNLSFNQHGYMKIFLHEFNIWEYKNSVISMDTSLLKSNKKYFQ